MNVDAVNKLQQMCRHINYPCCVIVLKPKTSCLFACVVLSSVCVGQSNKLSFDYVNTTLINYDISQRKVNSLN